LANLADLFYLKLLAAFFIGSLTITLATIAAERLGSKIGGLIGGLPVMIAITLFFIGLAESPQMAAEATDVIPLVVAFNGLFLLVYTVLSRWGWLAGLAGAFLSWATLSTLVVAFNIRNFAFSLVGNLVISVITFVIMEYWLRIPSSRGLSIHYSTLQVVSRASFAGAMVAFAVYMNRLGGPLWGGVFAPFPTVFISTLAILAVSKGVEYSRSITKPLLVSGMINIVVYAVVVRFFYPLLGLVTGTAICMLVAAASAYGTYMLMRDRMG
jgi:hypothetical protein